MRRRQNLRATAREQQRRRLLAALEAGPVSTLEARERLNVMHPGGRVMELRALGYRIVTAWSFEADAWGRPHRVGRYVLMQHARGAA
jgi:hypothetical protein